MTKALTTLDIAGASKQQRTALKKALHDLGVTRLTIERGSNSQTVRFADDKWTLTCAKAIL